MSDFTFWTLGTDFGSIQFSRLPGGALAFASQFGNTIALFEREKRAWHDDDDDADH